MNRNISTNKRLIKLVCSTSNKMLEVELTPDENQVKTSIAQCLNVPIEHIKGIKDVYNNYYTFSCAVKNPNINCAYSPYYTIVLSKRADLLDDSSCNSVNKDIPYDRKATYLKDNQYITDDVYRFILKVLQSGKDKYKKEIKLILKNTDLANKESIKIVAESILTYYNKVHNDDIHEATLGNQKTLSQSNSRSSILNIIETHIDDKNDLELLEELIASENNNSVVNIIETFVKDNNTNKLIEELKAFLGCHKEQHRSKTNIDSSIHSNSDIIKSYLPTRKWSINNMGNICERTELAEDIIYFIMKKLTFEEKIFFNYQRKINSNYYEAFEFPKSDKEHSIELIRHKCKEFLNETIINSFNNDETKTDKFYSLLRKKSPKIQDAFNSFLNHLDKSQLNKDIYSIITSKEAAKTHSTVNKHSLHKKSNTFFGVTVVNDNSSFHQANPVHSPSKSETNDFIKQIQNMSSLNPEQKSRAIGLYNLHDPKMVKLFCMFKRNKLSLTNQSLLKVISGLSTVTTPVNSFHNGSNHNKNKSNQKPKDNLADHNTSSLSTNMTSVNKMQTEFERICNGFVNDKSLSQNEVDFLVNKYKCGDEALESFYEVYIGSEDQDDFLESLQMYLKKHDWNVNSINDDDDDDNAMKTLTYILSKSKFPQHMKQIIFELYRQQNSTLLSFIEVYNNDEDIDETIESIELLLKKLSYVN